MRSGATRLLVDVGRSARFISGALNQIGEDMSHISAVLITHEHRDHIQALAMLAKHYDFLIVAHPASFAYLAPALYGLPARRLRMIEARDYPFQDLQVGAFTLSHDAANTFGFTFDDGTSHLGVATDLGCVTPVVLKALSACQLVAVDCNHDVRMLLEGSYPIFLKERILGERGHLSNQSAGELLANLQRNGKLQQAILAHLSKENNQPELARSEVSKVMRSLGVEVEKDLLLEVARRDEASQLHIV